MHISTHPHLRLPYRNPFAERGFGIYSLLVVFSSPCHFCDKVRGRSTRLDAMGYHLPDQGPADSRRLETSSRKGLVNRDVLSRPEARRSRRE